MNTDTDSQSNRLGNSVISFFENALCKKPCDLKSQEFIDAVKNGKWSKRITELRDLLASGKNDEYDKKKIFRPFVFNKTENYFLITELKNTNSIDLALNNAHSTTGRAIFYTATTIASGFCILILSNFFPTTLFGVFTAIAMIIAFIISLTLLPNLLVKFKVFQ